MPTNSSQSIQGFFTSTGAAKLLNIPSGVNWMEVMNYTQLATQQSTGRGVKFFWQQGMNPGTGVIYTKTNSTDVLNGNVMASGGFTPYSGASPSIGAAVTGTTITKASPPVCTATAHGYSNGQVVRIIHSDNMSQINGVPFTINNVATNTFDLAFMNTNTANFTAATSFTVRSLPSDMFQPQRYYITAITQAASAVITLSVTHNFLVNDVVRILVPSAFGMTQINEAQGQITAIDTTNNTITVNINSSGYTAFAWPATTAVPMTFAQVVPIGQTQTQDLNDATFNQSINGMLLGAGVSAPAGSNGDVIYWRAGTSVQLQTS